MCQQPTRKGKCPDRARWLSPTGLHVCGTHKRSIDLYYARLQHDARCTALPDERGERKP